MANKDAPQGAWPLRHLTGGVIRSRSFTIASGYNTTIFSGDFVKLVADGSIEQAAAGERLLGVFAGCKYVNAQGEPKWSRIWPANEVATEIEAYVYADPNLTFSIQSAGSVVAADVGNLGDIVVAAGDVKTGTSAMEISGTTGTAAAQLRVLGKIDDPLNEYGTNVELEVQIYEHEFSREEPATPGV